jgi:hypothetical protein
MLELPQSPFIGFILSELGIAMRIYPHLKKEVAKGRSTSAKAIRNT